MITLTASFGAASHVTWPEYDRAAAERARDDAFERGATTVRFDLAWRGGKLIEVHTKGGPS
jgi:hypothetical protein